MNFLTRFFPSTSYMCSTFPNDTKKKGIKSIEKKKGMK